MSWKPVTDGLKWDTATPRDRIEKIRKVPPSISEYFMKQDNSFTGLIVLESWLVSVRIVLQTLSSSDCGCLRVSGGNRVPEDPTHGEDPLVVCRFAGQFWNISEPFCESR